MRELNHHNHMLRLGAIVANHRFTLSALVVTMVMMVAPHVLAQPGWVLSHQKISDTEGGFAGILEDDDSFGRSVKSIGDIDGDGVIDLAVGTPGDGDGGPGRGAVWVLFLNADGTVKGHQKISDTEGGFTGTLDDVDGFGISVASLGDLDEDGIGDLAVGAKGDDDGDINMFNTGAVWMLFLNDDGTVKRHQKISATQGGFAGDVNHEDWFGFSSVLLDDLDGDGVDDLAVGAHRNDDGGPDKGAVWILFLNPNGTVKDHQKISATEGGFTGELGTEFGRAVAFLGDHDGDGTGDLAVGARGGGGAVWILFLNSDGTVRTHQEINANGNGFGGATASLGDLDGDAVGDLAVGQTGNDDGGPGRGAAWILFLNADGTAKSRQKISDTDGGFTGVLDDGDQFGMVGFLGDLDDDGIGDLAVGAFRDDDGGIPPDANHGAVWILFLDGVPSGAVATLAGVDVVTGVLLDGDLADLEVSDDMFMHTRSGFGRTLVDLHHMEMIVSATTTVQAPTSLNLAIESRIDQPAGTAQIRLLNHNTQRFDLVGQHSLGNTDVTETINGIDATNYVDGLGEIELSIKHIVFVPFLAFTFESWIDWVNIVVR